MTEERREQRRAAQRRYYRKNRARWLIYFRNWHAKLMKDPVRRAKEQRRARLLQRELRRLAIIGKRFEEEQTCSTKPR